MLHPEIKPALVFCSYSHRDDDLMCELKAHLAPLTRQNLINFWFDRRIEPGDDWRQTIARELDQADIILLLISAYFISSDYCYKIELGRALERHKEGSAVVIPIFVRPCDYEGLAFSELQGLPSGGLSVSEYENRDNAWASVAKGVRRAVESLGTARQRKSPTTISNAEREQYEATTYLRHLTAFHRKEMRGLELSSLRAELNGQEESLRESLETWATGHIRPLLLLVGDAGSGKTWALRHLAATLAEAALREDDHDPQPVYVPFHNLQGPGGIEAIYKAVPEASGVLDKYREGRNTVLLLDGIDEVMLDSAETGLRVLIEILNEAKGNAGIALSSRTQATPELLAVLKRHRYQPLMCRILGVDTKETREYSPRAFNLILPPTMFSPRLPLSSEILDMILEASTGRVTDESELYGALVSLAIRDVRERDKGLATVPAEVLESFLTNLAKQMFPFVTADIGAIEIDDQWSSKKFDIINGLVASGLLAINSREQISFSHVLFFEYFFARLLFAELKQWNAEHLSRSNLIYLYNTNRFLIPMLLSAAPVALTPEAQRTRKQLQQNAVATADGWLTAPILQKDFLAFSLDTGWRLRTGFGHWGSFVGPSGSSSASDGVITPEQDHIFQNIQPENSPAVSLSWYDAYQFARWLGGLLPAKTEGLPSAPGNGLEFEWTSSWFSESESLIAVRDLLEGELRGVNPDVRSAKIGFRVQWV